MTDKSKKQTARIRANSAYKNVSRFIHAVILLLFLGYTTGIFVIDSTPFTLSCVAVNILLMVALNKSPLKTIKNLVLFLPFIILTAVFNYFFTNLETAGWVALRLAIVCNATYIYATSVSILSFAYGLEVLLFPLKLFKVNTRDISIVVAIAVTFIPIIRVEYGEIGRSLNAKGRRCAFGIKTQVFIYKILARSEAVSMTLNAKGYG